MIYLQGPSVGVTACDITLFAAKIIKRTEKFIKGLIIFFSKKWSVFSLPPLFIIINTITSVTGVQKLFLDTCILFFKFKGFFGYQVEVNFTRFNTCTFKNNSIQLVSHRKLGIIRNKILFLKCSATKYKLPGNE